MFTALGVTAGQATWTVATSVGVGALLVASEPAFLALKLVTMLWLTGYAFAAARAGHFLRRGRMRRALDALTGTVLVALGLRLAAEHR